MFLREKKLSGSEKIKLQLVVNYRQNGKVRQKILRHIGIAHNQEELKKLRELGSIVKEQLIREQNPTLFSADVLNETKVTSDTPVFLDFKKLREEQRIINGIHDIYGELYKEIGFDKLFPRLKISKEIIKNLVLARIATPLSKLATVEYLKRDFGINIKPEQVYRALDSIDDNTISNIQLQTFNYTKELFEEEINLVFYDCTTLYFESFTEDELKSFGYSKDHKFNQSQVLMALAVTKEGLPVGYDLFAGNFYEGYTLKIIIDKLSKRFNIKRMILVADSGLLNKDNIDYMIENNIEFIVGGRLKSLSKQWHEKILDCTTYKTESTKNDITRIMDFKYSRHLRLIVSHSDKRADKDRADREKAIQKLKKRLQKSKNAKSLISNYGYKKYINIEEQTKVSIDESKLAEAELWDGLHGVFTNVKDLSGKKILDQYHGLWQVEESFRIHKHDLLIRPVFHWTPKRIKAHVALVYMSFALVRFLQYKLHKKGIKLSPEKVKNELIHAQTSILKHTDSNHIFIIPSKPTNQIKQIYSVFNKKYSVTPSVLVK